MKIIDLLNKIANGEEVPKKIKYDNMIWGFDGDFYRSQNNYILEDCCDLTLSLNDEVEILEEEKKIPEKVDFDISKFNYKEYELNIMKNNVIANTKAINQIIDYLDYIKSKGDE